MAEGTMSCEQCQAAVTADQIAAKKAGKVGGKLLCPTCVADKIREIQAAKSAGSESLSHSGVIRASSQPAKVAATSGVIRPAGGMAAPAVTPVKDETEEPLSLVSETEKPGVASTAIRTFVKSSLAQEDRHENFNRELVERSRGATRCRTFHSKLTDAALSYLDNQINEWVDAHPEIHIKFATSTIGLMEAKQHQEPHVIMSVFY